MVAFSVHEAAYAALMPSDPASKCTATTALARAFQEGKVSIQTGEDDPAAIPVPGRPARPVLVPPGEVPRRKTGSREGHAALLHAIAHIEFNAINLALDCVHRFRAMPVAFHQDWVRIAAEEAHHFGLVQARLSALGFAYGDFPAHNGLWEMACRTAHDVLVRMALVPRVLEARGLDVTPVIMEKLRSAGDPESVAVLEVILQDEIGHVAAGDYWFRQQCSLRGLDPETTYFEMIRVFNAPHPQPPLHEAARRIAGFSDYELRRLVQDAGRVPSSGKTL